MDKVELSKKAIKDLSKLPMFLQNRFIEFILTIEEAGYIETMRTRNYRDEALLGRRQGQRSVRLNRSYRIIYTLRFDQIYILSVEGVNKHDY